MTIETQQGKKSWIGDGSTTNYPYSYPFLNASDIEVYLDGEKQASGFSVQKKTDYSTGANIIFEVAPAEGVLIVVRRNVPMTQEISYPENGEFPAKSHEKSLDKLTMLIIDNNKEALKVNPATPEDFNPAFPVPEANKALKITADGKGFTMSDYDPDTALVLTEDFKNQAQQAAIEALASQNIATEQANIATEQANIATEQANIATEQATIATNKTSEVVTSGNEALSNIDTAKSEALTEIETLHSSSVDDITNLKNTSVSNITTAKNNAITSITNQETTSKNNIINEGVTQITNVNSAGTTQINLAKEQVTLATQQANIATNKASEVVTSGNEALANIDTAKDNAITSITNQETTSKTSLIDEGATQIGLIQNEGATQVANVQSTGFYMRDDKLYYINSQGEETEFKSGGSGLEVCDIELNNPYSLFDSKYSPIELNNISWLKSNGQWNAKAVYPAAYNELLKEYNNSNKSDIFNQNAFEVVGSPTITDDGIASGFSGSNYLKTPSINFSTASNWLIEFEFTTPSSSSLLNYNRNVFGREKYIRVALKTNLTITLLMMGANIDWADHPSSKTLSLNTKYYGKAYFTGSSYKLDLSEDGINYSNYITYDNSNKIYSTYLNIGYSESGGDNYSWKGSIDLKQFSVTVNGQKIFSGTISSSTISSSVNSIVKLSTENYTDYDFVLNTADETFRLPLLDGSENLVDYNNPMTTVLNTNTVADRNGLVYLYVEAIRDAQPYIVVNGYTISQLSNASYDNPLALSVFVKRGDTYKIVNDVTTRSYYFFPCVGNGSLYYYVGETVQNANLIDAGRIGEQLVTKTDMLQASGAGMPSNKYIDLTLGANGSTYTAPANGWFCVGKRSSGSGQYLSIFNNDVNVQSSILSSGNNQVLAVYLPIKKGEIISINYSTGGSTEMFKFVYAEGAK